MCVTRICVRRVKKYSEKERHQTYVRPVTLEQSQCVANSVFQEQHRTYRKKKKKKL